MKDLVTRDELAGALREMVASHLVFCPPYEAGRDAQADWTNRKVLAVLNARTLLSRLEAENDPEPERG